MGNIKSIDFDNQKDRKNEGIEPVILICGFEKSGKSTLMKQFDNAYGYGVELEDYKNDIYYFIIKTIKEVNRELFKQRLSLESTVSFRKISKFTENDKND